MKRLLIILFLTINFISYSQEKFEYKYNPRSGKFDLVRPLADSTTAGVVSALPTSGGSTKYLNGLNQWVTVSAGNISDSTGILKFLNGIIVAQFHKENGKFYSENILPDNTDSILRYDGVILTTKISAAQYTEGDTSILGIDNYSGIGVGGRSRFGPGVSGNSYSGAGIEGISGIGVGVRAISNDVAISATNYSDNNPCVRLYAQSNAYINCINADGIQLSISNFGDIYSQGKYYRGSLSIADSVCPTKAEIKTLIASNDNHFLTANDTFSRTKVITRKAADSLYTHFPSLVGKTNFLLTNNGSSTNWSDSIGLNKLKIVGNPANNYPSMVEFRRNFGGVTTGHGSVGYLGSQEMNISVNMDYSLNTHVPYDITKPAIWQFMYNGPSDAFGYQYCSAGHANMDGFWKTVFKVDPILNAGEAVTQGCRVYCQEINMLDGNYTSSAITLKELAQKFYVLGPKTMFIPNTRIGYVSSDLSTTVLQIEDTTRNTFVLFTNQDNNTNYNYLRFLKRKVSSYNLGAGTRCYEFDANTIAQFGTRATSSVSGGGFSNIEYYWKTTNSSFVTADRMVLNEDGKLGIGTLVPTNILSLGGQVNQTIWCERNTTTNTGGNNLTIQAGGATSGATDKDGGMLVLSPGMSTGMAKASTRLQRLTRASSTSTSDNTLTDAHIVPSEVHITSESSVNLFEIALPAGSMAGGFITFQICATDGTDFQVHSGHVNYAAVNKGGVYSTQIVDEATTDDANASSTGTTTDTWAITSGSNKITISVTIACSSIVANDIRLYYTIHNGSRQSITQL